MTNQKLSTYLKEMPDFLKPKYLIKRIGEEDIEITENQRDVVLKALEAGIRFVQINNFTLMLNSIKSIDPKWGKYNIPIRPNPKEERFFKDGKAYYKVTNTNEIKAWDYWYGDKLKEYSETLKSIDKKSGIEDDDIGAREMFFNIKIAFDESEAKTEAQRVIESRNNLIKQFSIVEKKLLK